MLRRGLATANLTADDVIVVNVPPERHLSAFDSGAVDAVVTYDPDAHHAGTNRGASRHLQLVGDRRRRGEPAGGVARVPRARTRRSAARWSSAWWAGRDAFARTAEAQGLVGGSASGWRRRISSAAFATIELYDAARSRELLDRPGSATAAGDGAALSRLHAGERAPVARSAGRGALFRAAMPGGRR